MKRKTKPRSKSKRKRRKPAPPAPSAIVLRAPVLPEHRYALNRDQVELIKRTIAKGASDDELQLFLQVAKKHRLDPFTRQLHLIPRWNKELENTDGSKGGFVRTIQIGIDGYRQMASRYSDFGSVSKAIYGVDQKCPNKPSLTVPSSAEIRVYKKGLAEPSVGEAKWSEFAPVDIDDKVAFMWRKMPYHMLAKCAEALALRKAYPDLADIYTKEEMQQGEQRERMEIPDPEYVARREEKQETSAQQFEDRAAVQYAEVIREQSKTIDIQPKKSPAAAEPTDCLFYTQLDSDRYWVTGPDALKTTVRGLLLPMWDADAQELYGTANQVGKLMAQLETRGVKIRRRERQPGE